MPYDKLVKDEALELVESPAAQRVELCWVPFTQSTEQSPVLD